MWVRDAFAEDTEALADVFWRSVREGATNYSEAERAAWAPERPHADGWRDRISDLETVVAEDGDILGFMSLRDDGYLDLAFVLPEMRGKGISDQLYAVLEGRARAKGLKRLWSHASHMARPFFARHDWQELRPDPIERNGVTLLRFEMEKPLA